MTSVTTNNVNTKESLLFGLDILSNHISDINKYYQNDYYNSVKEEDVEFLQEINSLDNMEPSTKMKLFHCFVEIISSIILSKTIKLNESSKANLPYMELNIDDSYFQGIVNNMLTEGDHDKAHNILENLYPEFVTSISRKSTGTEFTSQQIVDFMLDEIQYKGDIVNKKLIDPSCGSGVFIISALERYLKESNLGFAAIKEKLIIDKNLVAVDINPINVFVTKIRFVLTLQEKYNEIDNNELVNLLYEIPILTGNTIEVPSLFNNGSSLLLNNKYDFVVGNPPYIRLHRLPKETREYIKDNFESATGRFDLYVCFIEIAVALLKEGGKFSLITSNKFLTTNYGVGIRNFLLDNTRIQHLVDLHDTEFFEAAVLPAIIVAKKSKSEKSNNFLYTSIKQSNNDKEVDKSIENVFNYLTETKVKGDNITEQIEINNNYRKLKVEFSIAKTNIPEKDSTWNFTSSAEDEIKMKLESISHYKMKDVAKVSVGVKPNPNTVFVNPMTHSFVQERGLEKEIVFPILRKDNVKKWHVNWSKENPKDRYILYPHTMENGAGVAVDIEKYPNAKKYIYENEEVLKRREYLTNSLTRKWYELWVPHDLEKFSRPKIVTKDISEKNNFALDTSGYICLGSIFWIYIKDEFQDDYLNNDEMLYYLLGICNSNVLEFYQKTISGSLYSKKVRYTSTNMNKWLVPKINNKNYNLVSSIIETVNLALEKENTLEYEIKLNNLVYKLFDLDENQINLIEDYLKTNS